MKKAYDDLARFELQRKHIILLTDGQSPMPPDYEEVIADGKRIILRCQQSQLVLMLTEDCWKVLRKMAVADSMMSLMNRLFRQSCHEKLQ